MADHRPLPQRVRPRLHWLVGRRSTTKYDAAHGTRQLPFWARVGVSASHCGGGCTRGDILAETLIYVTGIARVGTTIWASFAFDSSFALLLGIAFSSPRSERCPA